MGIPCSISKCGRNVASDASCTLVKFSRYAPLLREVSPYLLCRGCVETRPAEDIPRFREHATAQWPAASHALCLLAKLTKWGRAPPCDDMRGCSSPTGLG